ncbi:hypothetical protein [Pseudomonas qingdaonensis]|uniref:hypothetical protein n=1 Tax=Pseudomonas qingdaonensis TaxID=2056231 RepID=UPI001F1FA661|nr:hypothetical protein [Pseudomonas qingdaonensis]
MSQAKERPILFSGPMVRAILEGRKTVTRRPVKGGQIPRLEYPDSAEYWVAVGQHHPRYGFVVHGKTEEECAAKVGELGACPFGQPGDRLWMRETFMDLRGTGVEHRPTPDSALQRYAYAAECPPGSFSDETRKDFGLKWKPSIHMPRAACRILLEITDVRVERLQAITAEQAEAEGVDAAMCRQYLETTPSRYERKAAAIHGFPGLWQSTGGDWNANPWVWVVEFKRVQP